MKLASQQKPPASANRDAAALGDSNQYTAAQRSHVVSLTDAANVSMDATSSNLYELVATGAVGATRQLDNPTNLAKGMAFQIMFQQDGTGGRALTFDTFFDFGEEGAPDFTGSGANEVDVIGCLVTSATTIAATVGSGAPPKAHSIAGAEHTADTLANLNAKVSDATLDDVSGTRDPNAHTLAGAAHTADTLANLNTKISDATLDDVSGTRDPNAHSLGGAAHSSDTLANLNAKITDATLDDSSATRDPNAHAFAGAAHSADTFANLNTKVSDETLAGLGTSQQYTKNQRGAIVALTDAATTLINADDGNVFELTATVGVGATRQLDNPTNLVAGMSWMVIFNQDATGGRALTFDTFYDFGDEGAPDFSAQTANISNIISCVALSTTQIACSVLTGFA